MQLLLIFLSIASVLLFRRIKIRNPWIILTIIVVSSLATVMCGYVMVSWSKISREFHYVYYEDKYSSHSEEDNFVTANISIFLKTAYSQLLKPDIEQTPICYFEYSHHEGYSHTPSKYTTFEQLKADTFFNAMSNILPKRDMQDFDHLSMFSYIYPSRREFHQNVPRISLTPEDVNATDHFSDVLPLVYNSIRIPDSLSVNGKDFKNKIEYYVFVKGMKESTQLTFTHEGNHSLLPTMIDYVRWFVQENDLSRAEYVISLRNAGIDSTNVSLCFDEPVDIQKSWFQEIGKTLSSIRYGFNKDQVKSKFHTRVSIHARLLESENIQQIRMFFISTLCALALGILVNALLSAIGVITACLLTRNRQSYEKEK